MSNKISKLFKGTKREFTSFRYSKLHYRDSTAPSPQVWGLGDLGIGDWDGISSNLC